MVPEFRVFINRKPRLAITFCKLYGRYAANVHLLSYRRWRVASNLAQGQVAARVPEKPGKLLCTLLTEGTGGPRTFTYRPACCLTKWPVAQWGRPFTKQCNLTYAGQWAGRIANRSIG